MNLQGIVNSRRAGKLALFLSRTMPPAMGYRLAGWVAGRLAVHTQMSMVQAIQINQWVVSNGRITANQIAGVVLAVCGLAINVHADAVLRSVRGGAADRYAIHHRGLHALALSLPEADQAVEWQHEFRRRAGLEILPATLGNIRRVIDRLQSGATVLTGIDRPMPGLKYRPRFFGRPALLPTQHIYLALKAQVPLVVMGCILGPDGRYHIRASEYIKMRPSEDRHSEVLQNAERVLEIAAEIICQAPHQWMVNYPIWPEAATEMHSLMRGGYA